MAPQYHSFVETHTGAYVYKCIYGPVSIVQCCLAEARHRRTTFSHLGIQAVRMGGLVQEAVRLRASYADAFTGMGVSLKELKRKEEAEHCFAQVVRLRPHCALSLGNLAGESHVSPNNVQRTL